MPPVDKTFTSESLNSIKPSTELVITVISSLSFIKLNTSVTVVLESAAKVAPEVT